MNRRMFLKMSSGAAVAVVILPTTGCAFSVVDTLDTIIEAVSGILSYVGSSEPWAVTLQNALTKLEQVAATWTTGSDAAILIDALNAVEAVLAVIPLTAVYSPLIDLVVAGVEAIINYFAKNTPAVALKVAARNTRHNPRIGRVTIMAPHAFQTPVGAFKQQYNDAAIGCGCPQLKLK